MGETNRSWHQNNPAVSHCGRFTDAFTVYKNYSCFKGFSISWWPVELLEIPFKVTPNIFFCDIAKVKLL